METEIVSYHSYQGQTLASCQKPCSGLTHSGKGRAWISPRLLPESLWALCGTLLVGTQAGWPEDTVKARVCSSGTCPGVMGLQSLGQQAQWSKGAIRRKPDAGACL